MSNDWFSQMTDAVRKREIAVAGLNRWQEKVNAAEGVISELSAQRDVPAPQPSEAEKQEEISAAVPSPFQPVFGLTTQQA